MYMVVSVLLGVLTVVLTQSITPPQEPALGQRCAGRNYNGRRCCTPQQPCDEGEGDCDGPGDGGQHDGHAGCKGDLVCGSNNCLQFGLYYHPKDDCCERPQQVTTAPFQPPPLPPATKRRPSNLKRCTIFRPCVEGEADCDRNSECRGSLVCGHNNCHKFGSHFHPLDDCCEKSVKVITLQSKPQEKPHTITTVTPTTHTPSPIVYPGAFQDPPPGKLSMKIRDYMFS